MTEKNEINEKTQGCGGDASLVWAEALAGVRSEDPPGDVPLRRWRQFLADAARLIDDGTVARVADAGWGAHDLFSCDQRKPFGRVDQMGLLWFVRGGRIVSASMSAAVIETATGARQTYRRKGGTAGLGLVWEFSQRTEV